MVKADRTQIGIHAANLDEVNAQKDLVEQQIALTKLTAPFDGTVVKGELTRLLGTPFKRSDVLFTLAQGTGLRVVVDVGERDIENIKVGQSGRLVLSARPSDRLDIHIARISPVATVTAEGQNVFEVEANIDGSAQSLAPGMKGTAKIDTGTSPIAWHWAKRAARALYYFGWSRL
jgi:multidrug efflux pump subunit AcrA (membrane-fusion protein)